MVDSGDAGGGEEFAGGEVAMLIGCAWMTCWNKGLK